MTDCKDIEGCDVNWCDEYGVKYSLDTNKPFTLIMPEYSGWQCQIFGITLIPLKGEEPNWFWRKMQYLCFGFKWVKDER